MAFLIIPAPAHVKSGGGTFTITTSTTIALSDPDDGELRSIAGLAVEMLEPKLGAELEVSAEPAPPVSEGTIALLLAPGVEGGESYELRVTTASIAISAATHAGLFYGLQTLRQLLPSEAGASGHAAGTLQVPAATIDDRPRFSYRGMHLDVGRHFFPVSFIKRYIDLLAMYKMNTFHWHLTEDQGWRVEVKTYPRLTEVGAFRRETIVEKNFDPYIGDGIPYGGYYTQEEIREVVEYARSRYVTVIPEIEMPGHSTAALAAYPQLACTDGPFEVSTRWGVHEDIYCPKEETFAFLEDVLTEVMDLFPSRYIHIGGDEAPKRRWEESDVSQEVMRREGLAVEHELQSYFIKRIETFLLAHGRRLIGWDEILEGGLAPEATVMSWRGMAGGIEAAKQGHDVIMTPTSHVYFDYYQGDSTYEPLAIGGFTPLEKVYAFEPLPHELTPQEAKHVLGAQGNVWTEYMKTTENVEYMVVPRVLALAEVVWSPKEVRDWDRFAAALPAELRRLDAIGVNYRIPHVDGLEQDRITLDDQITIYLRALISDAQIRYTTDGSDPTEESTLYSGPFELPVDESGMVVTARAFLPNGRASGPRAARFLRTSLKASTRLDAGALADGLRYAYFETRIRSVEALEAQSPARQGIARTIGLEAAERDEHFGLVFTGYLRVPADAIYTFYLTSDDGSRLIIGDALVIDHDGPHTTSERSGMIALEAGHHSIEVHFFQAGGGKALSLTASVGDEEERQNLTDWLFHDK
ncbi:MAG: family 20 glycosylhydrolase [Gemmatimonadota bacterium]|nr:MAG: family 20 glycosylhydrolase [Gemmatimonadota bacterium]